MVLTWFKNCHVFLASLFRFNHQDIADPRTQMWFEELTSQKEDIVHHLWAFSIEEANKSNS